MAFNDSVVKKSWCRNGCVINPIPIDYTPASKSSRRLADMARVLRLTPGNQRIEAHDVDKGVECEHKVVADSEGDTLLHLSTFGSKDRESHRKSSQSLQFDVGIAAELVDVLRTTFGDDALQVHPRLDVAFPGGSPTADLQSLARIYRRNSDVFRALISSDDAAADVIALANRRKRVEEFRRLLEDDDYFDSVRKEKFPKRGNEAVWQNFFEENSWIFGVSLSGQLLTSWSPEKLEQVVSGHSIASVGKRTDALLRTSGRIQSMVFAEIKTHRKELLEPVREPYRSGCWAPSFELSGGVVQIQGTVHRAVAQIGERLADTANDGSDIPGKFTYLLRPRSYLVIGNLASLHGQGGGENQDKVRSFELYRRELIQPEIVTFDELLARAEWTIESAATNSRAEPAGPQTESLSQ
ncbi:Shedu immune nuclease family protein [Nocardia tengchongensis]|uniref:Shedu immune nuclease family protein n=1 Tax=Nocardia tengchongensis TaxID=2055889 RepID=UPI00368B0CD1